MSLLDGLLAATVVATLVGWAVTAFCLAAVRRTAPPAPADIGETAARLALAEEAGGVGLWDIDLDARTVTYSPGAAALRGLPAVQVTMRTPSVDDLVHPDDRARFNVAREAPKTIFRTRKWRSCC